MVKVLQTVDTPSLLLFGIRESLCKWAKASTLLPSRFGPGKSSSEVTQYGGSWLFRGLPLWLLIQVQPFLHLDPWQQSSAAVTSHLLVMPGLRGWPSVELLPQCPSALTGKAVFISWRVEGKAQLALGKACVCFDSCERSENRRVKLGCNKLSMPGFFSFSQ